uniref:Uncharacterized protein n=1 Tax=Haemonchus contortus TaxID=6289 RepID=A0A912MTE3_HAECO
IIQTFDASCVDHFHSIHFGIHSFLMILLYFLIPQLIQFSYCLATPMYTYIKALCPPGLMPLTGARRVRTCDTGCPPGSSCINGICCTSPPRCDHPTYR